MLFWRSERRLLNIAKPLSAPNYTDLPCIFALHYCACAAEKKHAILRWLYIGNMVYPLSVRLVSDVSSEAHRSVV